MTQPSIGTLQDWIKQVRARRNRRSFLKKYKGRASEGYPIETVAVLLIAAIAGSWSIFVYVTTDRPRDVAITNLSTQQSETLKQQEADRKKPPTPKLAVAADIREVDSNLRWRTLDLDYQFENVGAAETRVAFVIIQWHAGRLRPGAKRDKVLLYNPPRVGALAERKTREDVASAKPIRWSPLAYRACRTRDVQIPKWASEFTFEIGGCGTGLIQAGASVKATEEALYARHSFDFISASIYVSFGPVGREKGQYITRGSMTN